MINGHLEQFLDTGWYTEATLFYNGNIYWCEGQYNAGAKIITFFVDRWAAENENNTFYHSILESDGTLKWERIFKIEGEDSDFIKKCFLEAPLFDGKTFWQIEKQIAWLDESTPIMK